MSLRERLSALAASLVLLAGLAVAGPLRDLVSETSGAEPPPVVPAVGVHFHGMWSSYTDEERAQVLDELAAGGVRWVRLDVSWAMLQPEGPEDYDLGWGVPFVDRVITMITDRGISPLVMLWLTPAWANGGADERTLPDDPADFAAAARWAAERWADQVPAWEVWNEPNSSDFMRGADPVAYTRLLQAAYPALKAGNPEATVVFGGTQRNDRDWIAQAYDAGAQGSFDAMATHPYMGVADLPPESPGDGTMDTFRHLAAVHELMVERGDGDVPIWATEFGWRSHETPNDSPGWQRGVTEQEQADYLLRAVRLVQQEMPYVTHMIWYVDRDRPEEDDHLLGFGLLDADLQPKPVLTALSRYLWDDLPDESES